MPDWNRGQLAAELRHRGFAYLDRDSATRVNDFIQRAVDELVNEAPWPYRWTELETALPATIADLGELEQVTYESTRPLYPQKWTDLRDRYLDLTAGGTPLYYYLLGENQVAVYPTSTATATVIYYSTYGWLDSNGDRTLEAENDAAEPAVPSRYRDLIVELAVVYAQEDSEDTDERDAARVGYDTRLEQKRRKLLAPISDEPRTIRRVSGEDWA